MCFTKRKEAIIRCGSDRDLVLIFNSDLRKQYTKLSKGIPPPIFRSIVFFRDLRRVVNKHRDEDFYLLSSYFEKVLERNHGVLPPTPIEL